MIIAIPAHVANALSLDLNEELEHLREVVGLRGLGVGPLLTDEGLNQLLNLLERPQPAAAEICEPVYPVRQWCFRTIELDSAPVAYVVEVPKASVTDAPPTDAQKTLVQAWMSLPDLCTAEHQQKRNILLVLWLVTAHPAQELVRAMIAARPPTRIGVNGCAWSGATNIELRTGNRVFTHSDPALLRRLFTEACTQVVGRWRYLSFYRILENGYLENILNTINAEFYAEPKKVIEFALSAVKSEIEQFTSLVEKNGLQAHFEEMWNINERLAGTGNQFAASVKRESEKRTVNEPYKKGVGICYQIRCAIVHAGYAVIFDRSAGAEEALTLQLPELEKAVVHFLGIEFR